MNMVIGLLGYALLIVAASLIDIKLGIAVAGAICLYISYVNQPPRKGA